MPCWDFNANCRGLSWTSQPEAMTTARKRLEISVSSKVPAAVFGSQHGQLKKKKQNVHLFLAFPKL